MHQLQHLLLLLLWLTSSLKYIVVADRPAILSIQNDARSVMKVKLVAFSSPPITNPTKTCSSFSTCLKSTKGPKPIDDSKWPLGFPAKEHCSKCGLCETTFVSKVKDSCAFLNEVRFLYTRVFTTTNQLLIVHQQLMK